MRDSPWLCAKHQPAEETLGEAAAARICTYAGMNQAKAASATLRLLTNMLNAKCVFLRVFLCMRACVYVYTHVNFGGHNVYGHAKHNGVWSCVQQQKNGMDRFTRKLANLIL